MDLSFNLLTQCEIMDSIELKDTSVKPADDQVSLLINDVFPKLNSFFK